MIYHIARSKMEVEGIDETGAIAAPARAVTA